MSEFFTPDEATRRKFQDLSICIAAPHAAYYSSNKWATHTMNMIAYSWMNGLKIFQATHTERMAIHWARNDLARVVRENKCHYTGKPFTHILWLDDDHTFNPDMACYLAQWADRDMVSALYYGRTGRVLPVVYTKEGPRKEDDIYKHFPIVGPPNTLFECDAVGFGGLLMRVDVLDRFPYPWFKMADATGEFGEDIYFCVKAREGGARIWCAGEYKMGHIGDPQIIGEASYRKYMEEHKETMGDNVIVAFNTQ